MTPVIVSVTGVGHTQWFMPNFHMTPFSMAIVTTITSGTATYNIEYTQDDYWTPAGSPTLPWAPAASPIITALVTGATTSQENTLSFPVRGFRVNVTASTGVVELQAAQAGIVNY